MSMYPNLFVELARNPGWTNDDLKKVAGENFLRVFREAEQVRLYTYRNVTFIILHFFIVYLIMVISPCNLQVVRTV